MRCHYTPNSMAKIQNTDTPDAGKDVEQQELSSLLVGMQNSTASVDDSSMVSNKINIVWSYDPAIVLLGIYSKEFKTYIHAKTCTWMVVGALSITAKTWSDQEALQWVNGYIVCGSSRSWHIIQLFSA